MDLARIWVLLAVWWGLHMAWSFGIWDFGSVGSWVYRVWPLGKEDMRISAAHFVSLFSHLTYFTHSFSLHL